MLDNQPNTSLSRVRDVLAVCALMALTAVAVLAASMIPPGRTTHTSVTVLRPAPGVDDQDVTDQQIRDLIAQVATLENELKDPNLIVNQIRATVTEACGMISATSPLPSDIVLFQRASCVG